MILRRRAPLLLTLLLPLLLLAAACTRQHQEPPNVLLIVVDTLRADRLGVYGHQRPTSPNIDQLAARGVLYTHAYSQAPWTTPSIGALLTSQYPSVLGIRAEPDSLSEDQVLLAEVLKQHRYATGAVVSHHFLGSKWNFDQGFDHFDESNARDHDAITSPDVTEAALTFARDHRDEPFFLFVHYFDPHYDYIDHPEFSFLDPARPYGGPLRSAMVYTDLLKLIPGLGPRDVEYLFDLYDSEIAFTDRWIGALLDGFEQLGLTDDTLILFTADHGEEFLERKTVGHGGSLYNELIHVPLIVSYPDYRPTATAPRSGWPERSWRGTAVETPVALIDLFPTVLDYLGIAPDHPIAGHSLLADTPNAEPSPRTVFSETDWGMYRAAISPDHKIIHRLTSGERFFYNLQADPGEEENLTARLAQTGELQNFLSLESDLQGWLDYLEHAGRQADEVELSAEEEEKLRALGYLN